MSKASRLVLSDGQLQCALCREFRPPETYTVDSASPTGRGYRCAICREKFNDNKVTIVDPDFDLVPASQFPRYVNDTKARAGSWERVVALAKGIAVDEAVFVKCDPHYRRHYAVDMGIREAAKKLKARVFVEHGLDGVYVRNAKFKPIAAK